MTASVSAPPLARRRGFPGRSLGEMLAASLVSALTGVILIFWIPRLLSVEAFGYWRGFLLYAGYAGFLHLGMVDGALLHWSRPGTLDDRTLDRDRGLSKALLTLTVLHLPFVAAVLMLSATPTVRAPNVRHIAMALPCYALLFNLCGLVQVRQQSRLRFSAVALGMGCPGVLFVLGIAITGRRALSLDRLLVCYLLAWAVMLGVLLLLARRAETSNGPALPAAARPGVPASSAAYIRSGWAIMLANTSYGLMQSADRVTVNLTQPIHAFAIYSLSQSTIYVPVTVIAALSRVAFSHFAGFGYGGREAAYAAMVRALTLLWLLLLPYYFVVEWIVGRFLPRYVPGLGAGRVLLLSVLFLSLISIVQANTWSLLGRQRRFFAGSLAAVAFAFLTAYIGSRWIGSLTAVAWSQVLTAGLWWLGNERAIRGQSPLPRREIERVLAAFAVAAAGLYFAAHAPVLAANKIFLYYGSELLPVFFLFRGQLGEAVELLQAPLMRFAGSE